MEDNINNTPARMTPERRKEIEADYANDFGLDLMAAASNAQEAVGDLLAELAAVEAERDELQTWRTLIEDAPDGAREIAIDRLRMGTMIEPIIASWKKANEELRDKFAAVEEERDDAIKGYNILKKLADINQQTIRTCANLLPTADMAREAAMAIAELIGAKKQIPLGEIAEAISRAFGIGEGKP